MKLHIKLLFTLLLLTNICFSQEKNTKIVKSNPPLIVINNHIVAKEILDVIDPKNIKSVTVWKHEKATTLYGEQGKNGAIIITTKKISKRQLKKLYQEYETNKK